MKRQSILFFVTLGLLAVPATPFVAPKVSAWWGGQEEQLSGQEMQHLARQITVKVFAGESAGSGVMIAQERISEEKTAYLVFTNRHVVTTGEEYRIQTPDGETYEGFSYGYDQERDVAIVYFISNQDYQVGEVGDWTELPEAGEKVWAAGFPFDQDELVVTTGKVDFISERELKDGYRLGYTNTIEQGMSGGVILNQQGEVVGINGMGANPVLQGGYEYLDGTKPDAETLERMQQLSWGVPFEALEKAAPKFVAYYFPQGVTVPAGMVMGERELPGLAGQVNEIADGITVRIEGTRESHGSGVIVAKEGRTYWVLTANHVVKNGVETVRTADGTEHSVNAEQITSAEGLDLAVVQFQSRQSYPVATLGNYEIGAKERYYSFVSGFPGDDRLLSAGTFYSEERSVFNAKDVDTFAPSASLKSGYELVYTNVTQSGMSGGAVLDRLGRLIGIHGMAEGELLETDRGDREYKQVQLGYSLGVPVRRVLALLERAGIDQAQLNIETEKPSVVPQKDSEAIQDIFYAVKDAPQNRDVGDWLNYGNQLWRVGQNEEAVKAFEAALEMDASLEMAWYGRGLALAEQWKYAEASRSFQEAVNLKDNFPEAWREWGLALRNLGKYEGALVAYERAIELQPKNFALYYSKGYVLGDLLERYAEARDAYSRALQLRPHPFAYNNRGVAYSDLEKYEEAIADYNQALQLDPEYAQAYNNRGNAYSDLEKYEEAIADYNQALQLDPEYALAYNGRGNAYYYLEKYEEAIADYNQALQLDPEDAQVYYNRGNAYYYLEKYEEAIADYNQALQLDPEYAQVYNNRGIAYSDLEKYEEAIADYNQSIEFNNPLLYLPYNNRGWAYYKLGKYEQAIKDFDRALKLNPNYTKAQDNRKLAYEKLQADN